MDQQTIHLTATEWAVLDCLWEQSPQTMTQLAQALARREGWAKGTTTTMLRRMTEKGLLRCTEGGKARLYESAVDRHQAVVEETRSFLRRIHRGSVSMMMSAAVEQEQLSREEIDQMYEILRKMEENCHE